MRPSARGEKPGFKHLIEAVGFGTGILLTLDSKGGKFLCAIFRVHND
jgi:hypothetical protein